MVSLDLIKGLSLVFSMHLFIYASYCKKDENIYGVKKCYGVKYCCMRCL